MSFWNLVCTVQCALAILIESISNFHLKTNQMKKSQPNVNVCESALGSGSVELNLWLSDIFGFLSAEFILHFSNSTGRKPKIRVFQDGPESRIGRQKKSLWPMTGPMSRRLKTWISALCLSLPPPWLPVLCCMRLISRLNSNWQVVTQSELLPPIFQSQASSEKIMCSRSPLCTLCKVRDCLADNTLRSFGMLRYFWSVTVTSSWCAVTSLWRAISVSCSSSCFCCNSARHQRDGRRRQLVLQALRVIAHCKFPIRIAQFCVHTVYLAVISHKFTVLAIVGSQKNLSVTSSWGSEIALVLEWNWTCRRVIFASLADGAELQLTY